MPGKVLDKFKPNFSGFTVEVVEWTSTASTYFKMGVIVYAFKDYSEPMLAKRASHKGCRLEFIWLIIFLRLSLS